MEIEQIYRHLFESNSSFQGVYLERRIKLYADIVKIVKELKVESLIDIGCAYGLLVEYGNASGITSYGLDFPIDKLKEFHGSLNLSKDKIFYGSVQNNELINELVEKKIQAIVLLDTLRYIENVENIGALNSEYLVIKEINNNAIIRRQRRRTNQFDYRLYSPYDLLLIFPGYRIERIYATRNIFHLNNPSIMVTKLLRLVIPTYTVVMKRRMNGLDS
jgi:hypothetical protein